MIGVKFVIFGSWGFVEEVGMVFCIMNEVGVVLDFIMYNVLVDIYG